MGTNPLVLPNMNYKFIKNKIFAKICVTVSKLSCYKNPTTQAKIPGTRYIFYLID